MRRILERTRVWLTVRVFWRNKKRRLEALRTFSATEADSAWQISQVLPEVVDPAGRADLFAHILEEMHHAAEFERLHRQECEEPWIPLKAERDPIFDQRLGAEGGWKFFAYCQVGEEAAFQRFGDIARALPKGDLRHTLRRILRDEAGHVHGAEELVKEFGVPKSQALREIRRVKRRRFREAWLRMGRDITDKTSVAILNILYFIIAPLGRPTARRRLAERTRVSDPKKNLLGSPQISEATP